MPGESGVTVVTMLVCLFYFACEAAGALGARHSLRPLLAESGMLIAKLARRRGEIAKVCLRTTLFEKLKPRSPDERTRNPGLASHSFPDVAEFIIGRAFARPVGSSGLQRRQ